MSLVVVGLNHRNAPVDLLERMAVPTRVWCTKKYSAAISTNAPTMISSWTKLR